VRGEFPILAVEKHGGQKMVLLPNNSDTAMEGRQSLFWESRKGHCVVEPGNVEAAGRWYKVIENFGLPLRITSGAWLSGWLGERPEHFGIENYDEIRLPNGALSWHTQGNSEDWVIHVHGRKTLMGETLRNLALFSKAGFSQLTISLETDPKPFGLARRRSNLGANEWKQLEQAVRYALEHGASRIVLFGWSLGGMIVGQYLRKSEINQAIIAAIFDSPMFDVRNTLRVQAKLAGFDDNFADEMCGLISKSKLLRLLGYPKLEVDNFSLAKNSCNTQVPMLVLYSSNDGYVEYRDVYDFADLNPTTMVIDFPLGRHCRLRNSNVERYDSMLAEFISRLGT
jgi:hypothetical protein